MNTLYRLSWLNWIEIPFDWVPLTMPGIIARVVLHNSGHFFVHSFYKNFYMNIKAEICEILKKNARVKILKRTHNTFASTKQCFYISWVIEYSNIIFVLLFRLLPDSSVFSLDFAREKAWDVWVSFCLSSRNKQWLNFQSVSFAFLNNTTTNGKFKRIYEISFLQHHTEVTATDTEQKCASRAQN